MDVNEVKSKPFANENITNILATKTNEEEQFCNDIKFNPPLYRQRYHLASEYAKNYGVRKIVDMGCAECKLIWELRNRNDIPQLREIIGVDSDIFTLETYKNVAIPLTSEYLNRRENPLTISLLAGSITTPDIRLLGADMFAIIEVIEHLDSDILEEVPKTIFHDLRPRFVFITTPNSEFNILFQNFSGFRHPDHRFEWTREEFILWCSIVCNNYPWYSVDYFGAGEPPLGFEELGYCTQGAFFILDENLLPSYLALEKECNIEESFNIVTVKNDKFEPINSNKNETNQFEENLTPKFEENQKSEKNEKNVESLFENQISTNVDQISTNVDQISSNVDQISSNIDQISTNFIEEVTITNSKHVTNQNQMRMDDELSTHVNVTCQLTFHEVYTEIIRTEFPIQSAHIPPEEKLLNELDYYSKQIAVHEWNILTNEEGVCEEDLLSHAVESNYVYFQPGHRVGVIIGFVSLQKRLCSYPKIREFGDYTIIVNMINAVSEKRINIAESHYRTELYLDENSSEEERYSDDGYAPDQDENDDVINGIWFQTGTFVDNSVVKVPENECDWDS